MAKFSGAVVLTDLNDFISPSQACVMPVPVRRDERAKPVRSLRRAGRALLALVFWGRAHSRARAAL